MAIFKESALNPILIRSPENNLNTFEVYKTCNRNKSSLSFTIFLDTSENTLSMVS